MPAEPRDPNMMEKEIKQVGEIHALLTAPVEDGDDNWAKLKDKLLRKNMKPIKFVCDTLKLQPDRPRYKADWVKTLVLWVSDILRRTLLCLTCYNIEE